MSRSKIEMSSLVFKKIHEAAAKQDATYIEDDHDRWLSKKDDADLAIMTDAQVEVLTLGAKIFSVSISTENSKYYCFSGLPVPPILPQNLEEVEATPGLFSCVVWFANILSTSTSSTARDILQDQYKGYDNYSGHDLNDVLQLFPKLYFVKVNTSAKEVYLDDINRVTGSYICSGYYDGPLQINEGLRSRLLTLFEVGAETIPFNLPLQGILSYSWSAMFLDLYRCLEQLYTALKLKELVAKLPFEGSLAELAYLLENELSWRPKEQDALASILATTQEATRKNILSAFLPDITVINEYPSTKCAAHVYKLRNSHVHFRPAMKAETLPSEKWNEIVLAMCDAVDDVYEKIGADFLTKKQSSPIAE